MADIFDKVKIKELKGDDYIVIFPKEILDMGYHECNTILYAIEQKFPNKRFLGIPENIEFKEYDIEELEEVMKFIKKEIESRNEQS